MLKFAEDDRVKPLEKSNVAISDQEFIEAYTAVASRLLREFLLENSLVVDVADLTKLNYPLCSLESLAISDV